MLLDTYLPTYDFTEIHGTRVYASPERVYAAVVEVSANEIPLMDVLFGIRAIPARLMGKAARGERQGLSWDRPLLEQIQRAGFVLLQADAPREVVLGTVGKFWQASGGNYEIRNASEFLGAEPAGYAKSAFNFLVYEREGVTKVRTETRVRITDPTARRKFGAYWTLVHPGSALLRKGWLWAVKKRAERE